MGKLSEVRRAALKMEALSSPSLKGCRQKIDDNFVEEFGASRLGMESI